MDDGPLATESLEAPDPTPELRDLRETEALFRLSFEQAPIGIAIVALDGRWVRVNARLCEITGYTAEELMGLHFQQLTHPDDLAKDLALVEALLRDEIPRYELRKRYIRKDRSTVQILLHVSLMRDASGAPQRFVAHVLDRTEHEKLAEQLAISERMAAVGTLANGVSHEINNPLMYVLSNLQLVEEDLKRPEPPSAAALREIGELVAEARAGAERMQTIVRGLGAISRTEVEGARTIDVHGALDLAATLASFEIRQRAQLVRDHHETPLVLADESRLVQAFIHLLVNAAHAIPEGGPERNEVTLRTFTSERGQAVIEVSDTGGGISAEAARRIFDPFYASNRSSFGMGLDLSIAHAFITSMHGAIEVSSQLGSGTTFRVTLPPAARISRLPKSLRTPGADTGPTGARLLVVAEEPALRSLVTYLAGGVFEVAMATGRRDVLALLATGERFCVVVADMTMRSVSWPDLYEEIRAMDERQAARIVFIAGGLLTPHARDFLEAIPNERVDDAFDVKAFKTILVGLLRPG